MELVPVLRRFNRTYTQRIGVLEESYLGTGRPLNVSRLLFDIGQSTEPTLRELRYRLGLDSGYLSRMLAGLEAEGLVVLAPDTTDRRRRIVALTKAGRRAVAELDDRSQRLATRLVEPLTSRQQERLAHALATADLLVRAATVKLRDTDLAAPAAQSALRAYFAELDERFPRGFDPGTPAPAEPGAHYVVALSEGVPVAFGGVRPLDETSAEIKRMWVHRDWRGAGLGSRMLRHLEQLARGSGFTRVVLDTNGVLVEAIGMYQRAGYVDIERYSDNPYAERFFAKQL
jgi:DNA-binding MarR family transcriptional regulator